MEVCHKGLTSGNLFEKTTGRAETRMRGWWFPYVQVGGGLGFILQVMAVKPGTPRADLGEASFSQRSHSTWMNYSSSFSKNQTVFKLENLSSVEKWFIRSFPSRWRGCLCSSGRGRGWGGGRDLTWKPKEELQASLLQLKSLWLVTEFAMLWPLTLGYLPYLEVYVVHAELPDMVLDTEKSGIRVNFLEKISLVLFFFCFVFW